MKKGEKATPEQIEKNRLSHIGLKYPNRKPHIVTEETRLKLSLAKKGKPNGSLGRKHSEETKKKMSEAKKGKMPKNVGISFGLSGEKSNFWKGGISLERITSGYYRRKRRLTKYNAEGFHTNGEWELLKKQYNYTCPCCGLSEPEIKLTEDHIIPLSKGGSDLIENIQPLCKSCNSKKHTQTVKYNL